LRFEAAVAKPGISTAVSGSSMDALNASVDASAGSMGPLIG
jgi:hypothetical protein